MYIDLITVSLLFLSVFYWKLSNLNLVSLQAWITAYILFTQNKVLLIESAISGPYNTLCMCKTKTR